MKFPNSPLGKQVQEIMQMKQSGQTKEQIILSPSKLQFCKDYPVLFKMITSDTINEDMLEKVLLMSDDIERKKISKEGGSRIIFEELNTMYTPKNINHLRK